MTDRLRIGTAGIPIETSRNKGDTISGIKDLRNIHKLEAMELEFVHSVNIGEDKASLVKEAAKKNDIRLTCHGQYYINLNSDDKAKIDASKKRILSAAKRASQCGAWSMVVHAGFYM